MSHPRIYEGQIRDQLAEKGEYSKAQLQRFSTQLFQAIQQALLDDGHLRLHQFGSFRLKWSRERRGRHPQTGEIITIAAQPRIVFTPARALKERVNRQATDSSDNRPVPVETATIAAQPNPAASAETEKHPESSADGPAAPFSPQGPPMPVRPNLLPRTLIAGLSLATMATVYILAYRDHPDHGPGDPEAVRAITVATDTMAPPVTAPTEQNRMDPIDRPDTDTPLRLTEETESTEPAAIDAAELDVAIHEPLSEPFFRERPHKLKNGDSLWRLSDKNYINPFYWPHIYQANRYQIKNPNKLIMGQTIRLPTLKGNPGALTDEDRRRIAEGYFLVYRYYKKNNRPYPYYALLGANRFDPSVIEKHIYEIDEKDWKNLQLASN